MWHRCLMECQGRLWLLLRWKSRLGRLCQTCQKSVDESHLNKNDLEAKFKLSWKTIWHSFAWDSATSSLASSGSGSWSDAVERPQIAWKSRGNLRQSGSSKDTTLGKVLNWLQWSIFYIKCLLSKAWTVRHPTIYFHKGWYTPLLGHRRTPKICWHRQCTKGGEIGDPAGFGRKQPQ